MYYFRQQHLHFNPLYDPQIRILPMALHIWAEVTKYGGIYMLMCNIISIIVIYIYIYIYS